MTATDTRAYQGLEPGFRNRVERWIAAGQGAFWLPVGAGYRSHDRQIELRRQHCGTSDYAIWRMPSGQCRPPTAIPGTSRHESGQAVDIAGDKQLASQLAPQFGLHAPVRGEDWHFQAIGGTVPNQERTPALPGGTKPGGTVDDDECLIHLPSVGVPLGSLPLIPDKFGGQCLMPKSWGRAIGGAFIFGSGVIFITIGLVLLVPRLAMGSTTVNNLVGRVPARIRTNSQAQSSPAQAAGSVGAGALTETEGTWTGATIF